MAVELSKNLRFVLRTWKRKTLRSFFAIFTLIIVKSPQRTRLELCITWPRRISYGLWALAEKFCEVLKAIIKPDNVFAVFEQHDEQELEVKS